MRDPRSWLVPSSSAILGIVKSVGMVVRLALVAL